MHKKYVLIFLIILLLAALTPATLSGQAQAEPRVTAFAVVYEGDFVYVAGEATGLAGSLPPGSLDLGGGMKDIYLAKLRLDGTPVYSALIGGGDNDSAYALAVDRGVVYLLGETWSYDFPGAPGNAGESDAVLLALAADGSQVLWARRFGGSDQDAGRALALHGGNVYAAGITWSDDLLPGAARGNADGFLARVGLDGRLDWLTVFGGSDLDAPFGLAVSADGAWVAGQSFSRDFGGAQNGAGDAFAARFSLAGEQQLARLYGGREEDMAYGIALAVDGGAYLAGGTQSAGLTPSIGNHTGGYDGFLMRIAPDGGLLSTTYLGGTRSDYAHNVLSLPDGGALVSGVTYSSSFPASLGREEIGAGSSTAFITHLDSGGALVDAWLAGGDGDDIAYAAALTPGGLWLAGRFSTGPLGYALLVPPNQIPGVPLPQVLQPVPTATLALTATPQPTETPVPEPTPTLEAMTATALAEATAPAPDETQPPTAVPTSTAAAPEEALEPSEVAAITRTAAVALTQGTPAAMITVGADADLVTVTPPDDSGFPIGLVVGGGLLLAAGLGGAVYVIVQKRKNQNLD